MKNSTNGVLLVSRLLPQTIAGRLASYGYSCFPLCGSPELTTELGFHPDILLCRLPDGSWITDSGVLAANRMLFDSLCMSVRTADVKLGDSYPNDVPFNAFFSGNILYCSKHTAREIRNSAGSAVIFRQGYVKCSILALGNDSFITSDCGIARVLQKKGANVLLIRPGYIGLNGFSCGFIGGASAMLNDNIAVFFGDLRLHPDCSRIKSFLSELQIDAVSLSGEPLYDYGGLLHVVRYGNSNDMPGKQQ